MFGVSRVTQSRFIEGCLHYTIHEVTCDEIDEGLSFLATVMTMVIITLIPSDMIALSR